MNHPGQARTFPPQHDVDALSAGTRRLRLGADAPWMRRRSSSSPATVSSEAVVLALSARHRRMALSVPSRGRDWTTAAAAAAGSGNPRPRQAPPVIARHLPAAATPVSHDRRSDAAAAAPDVEVPSAVPSAPAGRGPVVSPCLVEEMPEKHRVTMSPEQQHRVTNATTSRQGVFDARISKAGDGTTSRQSRATGSGDDGLSSTVSCDGDSTCSSADASDGRGTSAGHNRQESAPPAIASKITMVSPDEKRGRRTKRVAKGPPGRRARGQVYHTRRIRRTKRVAKGPPGWRSRRGFDSPPAPATAASETSEILSVSSSDSETEKESSAHEVTASDTSWRRYFAQLAEYRSEKGDANVPKEYPENQQLSYWVAHQRTLYSQRRLTDDQIQQLEGLGLVWDIRGTTSAGSWVANVSKLIAYKARHGDTMVSLGYAEDLKLGRWVSYQRFLYTRKQRGEKNSLTDEREAQLNDLGFVWRVQTSSSSNTLSSSASGDTWWGRFAELMAYKARHGTTVVPARCAENPELGRWVQQQRKLFSPHRKKVGAASALKPEQIEQMKQLDGLGFVWRPKSKSSSSDATTTQSSPPLSRVNLDVSSSSSDKQSSSLLSWDDHVANLIAFKKRYGHTRVPFNYAENPKLARWVRYQRSCYSKKQSGETVPLTDEREARLNELGFVWDASALPRVSRLKKNPPNPACAEKEGNAALLAEITVGTRVSVHWPDDQQYYPARITGRVKGSTSRYTLLYTDGETETVDLAAESFRIIGGKKRRAMGEADNEKDDETGSPGAKGGGKKQRVHDKMTADGVENRDLTEEAAKIEERRRHGEARLLSTFGAQNAALFNVIAIKRVKDNDSLCDVYWVPKGEVQRLRSMPEVSRYLLKRGLTT